MKKLIASVVIASTLLTGCAARDAQGNIEHNADGSEKISWIRTTALVVGAPLLILGVAAMAKNGGGNGGGYSQPSSGWQAPTAQCMDGSYSYSEHAQGTCSHHGGVAQWINHPAY